MKTNRREAIASFLALGTSAIVAGSGLFNTEAQNNSTKNKTFNFNSYTALTYNFDGLKGLDKEMLEQHYALYKGYVNNVNKAQSAMAEMLEAGKADTTEFSEIRRRLGFEYAGMRLHEYYFGMLKPEGSPVDEKLKKAVSAFWGSWENWLGDITRTAMMRGIGWAILYYDTTTKSLQNFWISDHENGNPPGFMPIFVIDVWEHAYVKQFGAGGRKAYIDSLLKNVDWAIVAQRLP
jgi:Fe-Mn family superoxide dismutase